MNCSDDFWCRTSEDPTLKQCVPYSKENQACGGFLHSEIRCESSFSCEERYDSVELFGKCTSKHNNCQVFFEKNGQTQSINYSIGESFQGLGDNWCNTCLCGPNGDVGCTKKYCFKKEKRNERSTFSSFVVAITNES